VEPSAALRDQLIAEIANLTDGDDLALWAHRRLPGKNSLMTNDARTVEVACQGVLDGLGLANLVTAPVGAELKGVQESQPEVQRVMPLRKLIRKRDKAHLAFVAAQPCLVCRRSPCDAHHPKFAQPRSLGRKVSDEFTVPLCRHHHQDVHRLGNEVARWNNVQIAPIEVAKDLWQMTLLQPDASMAKGRLRETTITPKP
jgi:hypothetical protein